MIHVGSANASAGAKSRLRRIETSILKPRFGPSQSDAPNALVLSCIRDYFAGVDIEAIADIMRHGGMEPEMIRYYTEDIFATAKAELTEWQEHMDEQVLAIPSSAPE